MKAERRRSPAQETGRRGGAKKPSMGAKRAGKHDLTVSDSDSRSNDSVASKLLTTANIWRRSGNAHYRRRFGISITDVRIITLLDARAPLSLNAIASHCGTDKTQMS